MYLHYIYFMLRINTYTYGIIHTHILKNTLQLYFWYTKLVYIKSDKLEQLILYLMLFNCAEVMLKSNKIYTEVYLLVLKWNYIASICQVHFKYLIFKD